MTSTTAMNIAILSERRYLAQEQPLGTVAALREAGHAVRVVVPDEATVELSSGQTLRDNDLVIGRGRSEALLCWLSVAESIGVPTVNRAAAVRGALHKEVTGALLGTAGLPVPPTWLLPVGVLADLPCSAYPLVVKPPTGDNGRGVRLLTTPDEAAALPDPERLVLAQSWVPFDGEDVKLYVIGAEVFAARKPSPLTLGPLGDRIPPPRQGSGSAARPWPVTRELREIALSCASLTGLDLLGVDVVLGPEGPVVVEVNDFPNYSCVPLASERICDRVLSWAGEGDRCVSLS